MEMMIVIAIIVVLVAISIPTFTGSIDKANSAADAANLRAAKSLYINMTLGATDEEIEDLELDGKEYDIESGEFKDSGDNGKCTKHQDAQIIVSGGAVMWSNGEECGAN